MRMKRLLRASTLIRPPILYERVRKSASINGLLILGNIFSGNFTKTFLYNFKLILKSKKKKYLPCSNFLRLFWIPSLRTLFLRKLTKQSLNSFRLTVNWVIFEFWVKWVLSSANKSQLFLFSSSSRSLSWPFWLGLVVPGNDRPGIIANTLSKLSRHCSFICPKLIFHLKKLSVFTYYSNLIWISIFFCSIKQNSKIISDL
jgi:hypothetical protein